MEDILNSDSEIKSIKSRIIKQLPNINQIIKDLIVQIDPTLFNTLDEFELGTRSELQSLNSPATNTDSATATVEEIDVFFNSLNYSVQPSPAVDKSSTAGKKIIRAQSLNSNSTKSLADSRSESQQSLTPTNSQQNLNSLKSDDFEIDRTVLKKLTEIKLSRQFIDDISTNYDIAVEEFREMCSKLDMFLGGLKMPKAANIKTLTVNPEANRLALELNKAMKNLISILQIDLNQANDIFETEGDAFPLYEVLTELYQII